MLKPLLNERGHTMKARYCVGQIVTQSGDIDHVVYRSNYPIGTRGNFLDLQWKAYNTLGHNSLESPDIISVLMRYADVGQDDTI